MQNCCGYYGSENPLCKTIADILWIHVSRMQNCFGYYGSADPGHKTVADIMDPRIQDAKLLRIL